MIDFHAHVLPGVDDGARDVDTSLAMLSSVSEQGVETVVATPHFYGGDDTIEKFLDRRQHSYERLLPHLRPDMPALRLGAEVLLREGVSRQDLRPLCLQGTEVLLVEMPFMPPPFWLPDELESIALGQGLTVMLAHLDRYMPWCTKEMAASLLELPDVIVQLNADAMTDKRTFRRLCRWLPEAERLVLGSDMHNMQDRVPHIADAIATMTRNRIGRRWLERIETTIDKTMTF